MPVSKDYDCLDTQSLIPNDTVRAQIQNCQESAEDVYCYPPSGTRICLPANIPLYWPRDFFNYSTNYSMIGWTSYELKDPGVNQVDNTGETSIDVDSDMFIYESQWMVGNGRSIAFYLQDINNFVNYNGPTLTLVPTSTSSATSTATAHTYSPSYRYHDQNTSLGGGAIAGIVLGAIGSLFLVVLSCCCLRPAKKGEGPFGMGPIVIHGGVSTLHGDGAENGTAARPTGRTRPAAVHRERRDEEAGLPEYSQDEPPKYKP